MTNYNYGNEATATIYDDVLDELPSAKVRHVSNQGFKLGLLVIALTMVLPFFFGGINYFARYSFTALTLISVAFILFRKPEVLTIIENSPAKKFFLFAGAISAYFAMQYFLLSPVTDFLDTALSWWFFFAAVFIGLVFCHTDGARKLQSIIIYSAFAVSLVALAHWFYDTGLLFWTFEPQFVFTSERARWPFVNANHLGNFLLLAVFLGLARFYEYVELLVKSAAKSKDISKGILVVCARSKSVQLALIKLGATGVVLLSIFIAITACLSRGTWTGAAIGLLVYVGCSYFFHKQNNTNQTITFYNPKSNKKKNHDSRFIRFIGKIYKPSMFVVLGCLFLFLLNDQGQELVEGRIEYGLKNTLTDIRWTMYADSARMLVEHPFIGIGLGQWPVRYPAYTDASLAGLYILQLHSDPYQILVELGFLGGAMILVISGYLVLKAVKSIADLGSSENRLLLAVLCGLIAFFIASLVEFPLRMPAIQAMLAFNLALFMHCSSNLSVFPKA